MPDPVSQIYLQARGGTNDFTQPLQAFMQSRQLRQQREQFDEELSFKREQLEQQSAMDQLRVASQRLLDQERGLDIQLKILAKERELQLQGARAEGMQLLLEAGRSGWSTTGLEDKLFNLLDRNPALNGDALVGQPLVKSFLLAREQRAAADRLKAGSAALMEQAGKNDMEISGFRVDDQTGVPVPTLARKGDAEFERLLEGLPEAEKERRRNERLNKLTDVGGETIEIVAPDGTVTRVSKGSRTENLTPAARAAAVDKITKNENSLFDIQEAQEELKANPRAVGPVGKLAAALDFIRLTINPNARPSGITNTRLKLAEIANDLIPSLKADSQMSNYERKKLERIIDFDGWSDTTPRALEALTDLQDNLTARALRERKAKVPGLPLSPRLLNSIRVNDEPGKQPHDEVLELLADGLLTKEEAAAWFDQKSKQGKLKQGNP